MVDTVEQMIAGAVCDLFPDANDYEERDEAEHSIRRIVATAVAAERERCEVVAEHFYDGLGPSEECSGEQIADAIRKGEG